MSESKAGRYTQGSVFGHVSGLSVTSAIGLFAIFIVDLVDVFFISILGQPELAAAVGFAGIGLFFGAAVCIGLAIAVSTLVAQAIGANQPEHAERLATHGLLYTLLFTVPISIASVVYAPEFLALFGAEGTTLTLAVEYFRIVGASLPILGLAMSASSLLRAVGEGRLSMWATIAGGVVNAVLDPLFIFGLALGLPGAAAASVVSRMTVAGFALWYVWRKHQLLVRPQPASMLADIREINTLAVPSLLTNLSGPLGSAYATSQMARYGTDAVAAASVIGRLTPVAFAGLYGLSGAVGPVASQNVGAEDWHRVRQTLLASAAFVVMYVIPAALLLWLARGYLVTIFGLEQEAAELLNFYCTWIAISYALFGLQLAANPMFTALRHPAFATVSNVVRDLCLGIPLILAGSLQFGAVGVLGGQALANALAGVLAFSFALWMTQRAEQGRPLSTPELRHLRPFHRHLAPGVQHRGH